jgi:predicted NBD/HSP70 family sugar kinase
MSPNSASQTWTRAAAFEVVRKNAPISAGDLEALVKKEHPEHRGSGEKAVRLARASLEIDGWIEQVPPSSEYKEGTRTTQKWFGVGPATCVLAFAVTRERLRCAVVGGDGARRGKGVMEELITMPLRHTTVPAPTIEQLVDALARVGAAACKEANVRPSAVSLAWPGQLDDDAGGPNLTGLGWDARLDHTFEQVCAGIGITAPDITLVNDADAEFLAESRWGTAKGRHVVIGVKLAGGIGSSLIVGQQIHRGEKRTVGEMGHIEVDPTLVSGNHDDALPLEALTYCSCGTDAPHLERFASGRAMVERLVKNTGELAHGYEPAIARIGRSARSTQLVLRQTGELVAQALAGPVLFLEPDVVVISGAIADEALIAAVKASLTRMVGSAVDVVPGTVDEEDANWNPVLGAAAQAQESIRFPRFVATAHP